MSDEYREWIALIKDRIKNGQIKASFKVNRELLERTAVNKQLTGDGDNPVIGLLICKDKNNVFLQ